MTPTARRGLRIGLFLGLLAGAVAVGRLGHRVYRVAFQGAGMDPEIPAEYRVPPTVVPELAEHTKLFEPRVVTVGRVHVAIGYGLANVTWIEGTDGIIVVDTGETKEQAEKVLAEIRKTTDKPVAGVVLTHHHADHVLGTSVFVSEEDAKSGKVPIVGHDSLVSAYVDETGMLAELQAIRAAHMYGGTLGPAEREGSNAGIGPFLGRGPSGFLPPNKTFHDALSLTISGVKMELRWVPSEAESEIAAYLPDDKTLLSAEVIQDHTFPNVYTIRGARYRDPLRWVSSIDLLRTFDADHMILQHGPPVEGRAEVQRVLTLYRDEIQFVHDQTIRRMNQGLTAQEIAETVELPPHLGGEKPWGREYYGTVKHSVRNIYGGYVGWFQGDPVDLDPTPRAELARRTVALMGGREKVLSEAKRSFEKNDSQFAAELATLLIRIDTRDMDARHLKAAAFRKLGYAQTNASWRNFYLVSAMELDDQVPSSIYLYEAKQMLGPAFRGLPADNQMATLPTRLAAERALSEDVVVGVRYTDDAAAFRLHLRRGVLEVAKRDAADASFQLRVTRASMGDFLSGTAASDLVGHGIDVDGDSARATRFLDLFERAFREKPEVVVR
ncbi:MAG TPA: alkyl sulfatase dimerization domain-containing protein [Polyangiaceae bacterium]|nr:alkyl sulfatase dimerization domain-containing protein [Polyangiaceae bacterium]